MPGLIENFKRLQRLLSELDHIPDAAFLQALKGQMQTLEQRVNLLEAYLQSDGKSGRSDANLEPVQSALTQIQASLQSSMQLMAAMQSGIKRNEESVKSVRERLDKLERTVQALSIKAA